MLLLLLKCLLNVLVITAHNIPQCALFTLCDLIQFAHQFLVRFLNLEHFLAIVELMALEPVGDHTHLQVLALLVH